jgi:hypothetical protein
LQHLPFVGFACFVVREKTRKKFRMYTYDYVREVMHSCLVLLTQEF